MLATERTAAGSAHSLPAGARLRTEAYAPTPEKLFMTTHKTIELPAERSPSTDEGEVKFIGNATTLIRFAGFTILTDPTFLHQGGFVHLGHGMYARRNVEPACQPNDLPPLDLCVLSHFHGDHFDQVAIAELDKNLRIVSTQHAVDALARLGFKNGYALGTWESQRVVKGNAELVITAMPARHGRDHIEHLLPPVNGTLLDFSVAGKHLYRLYISGDTILYTKLYEIRRLYKDIDLGLFHTGGTTLLGVIVTMTGAQGVKAAEIIQPRVAIPIHYNDYSVFLSGLGDFQRAAAAADTTVEFKYLKHGESYHFKPRDP